MLGEHGSAEELATIGPRFPLMEDEKITLFGYSHNESEVETLARRSTPRYPVERVRHGSQKVAAEALAYLEETAETFVVHFHVYVIGFVDFPVAQINAGLTFREALARLGVFAASSKFAGLVITEFNPDHAEEEGEAAATLVREVVYAVAGKKAPERSDGQTDRERG